MYSAFINTLIADQEIQHLKVNICLLKTGTFKRMDMAKLDYPTWLVPVTKHGVSSHAIPWFPEDRYFRMLRWRCLSETFNFKGFVEVYPPH